MASAQSLRVMVVDDQLTMRSLLRSGLQQLGVGDVMDAPDGEQALRALVKLGAPVHLIISDYNMPQLDGLNLLRAVRAHPPISKTAFIMLTGRADRDLVVKAKESGVNNYLIKPFTTESLRDKIEAVLGALT